MIAQYLNLILQLLHQFWQLPTRVTIVSAPGTPSLSGGNTYPLVVTVAPHSALPEMAQKGARRVRSNDGSPSDEQSPPEGKVGRISDYSSAFPNPIEALS